MAAVVVPAPIVVASNPAQPWPPGFVVPGAPYGVYVMEGVTFARPAPTRLICFRRDRKLMFFLAIAILAGIAIILLFALTFPSTGVLIMCILIVAVLAFEYLVLGEDCATDPMTGLSKCTNQLQ